MEKADGWQLEGCAGYGEQEWNDEMKRKEVRR
jgi:hypothetical protein